MGTRRFHIFPFPLFTSGATERKYHGISHHTAILAARKCSSGFFRLTLIRQSPIKYIKAACPEIALCTKRSDRIAIHIL